MTDIKDAVTAAFESNSPAPEAEPITEAPYQDEFSDTLDSQSSTGETSASPSRDEKGRFLPKNQQKSDEDGGDDADNLTMTEEAGDIEGEEEEHEPEKPAIPRTPSGFGKNQTLWAKLNDPTVALEDSDKQEILDFVKAREQDFHKGLAQYKDVAAKSHYLSQALEPYVADLQKENIDPKIFVGNLAKAHFILSKGSPQEKLDTFNYLMQQYGVQFNPQQQQFQQIDPMTQQMMDSLRGIENRVKYFEDERLQNQERAIQSEIQAIQANVTDFPLFEQARESMAQLLDNGHATTFEEAYRKAIRLDDDLWSQHSARLTPAPQSPKPNPTAQLLKKKQAAVSVKSDAPVGIVTSHNPRASKATNDRNSIRELLAKAME